jgi:uncharacterized paraquat-inducible protein A
LVGTHDRKLTKVAFFFLPPAGGQELAILIFLLSFAWPYTKTVITFVLWFASPKFVSVERRGAIFIWLDALAKWSFADIFVLILTIVSFRVSVKR